MMTEGEAKTKWCPFAMSFGRLTQSDGESERTIARGPQNRGFTMGGALHNCMCLGSVCMAWRWAPDETKLESGEVIKHPRYRSTPIENSPGHFDNAPLGYCGLAGAPQ